MTLVNPFRLLVITLLISIHHLALAAAEPEALGPLSIAERFEIDSAELGESREFYVSLPESYDSESHHYPVLYLLDADQNMQHAVASARMLAQWRGIPELIIVGIPSTNRLRDFTPTQVIAYSDQSGGGDQFMAFLKLEIIPHIDASYRTHPFRILSGHSLSGLIAADELVQSDDVFNAYIIIAPSLWWHDFQILTAAEQHFRDFDQDNTAVYFGIGELDGYGMKQELQRFVTAIDNSGTDKVRYAHREYSNESHMSAPLSVVYDGLLHIFADIPYTKDQWIDFSENAFMAREQSLQDKYGSTAMQTAENYITLANHLLAQRDYDGAVVVFSANAAAYPGFAPYHDWLANALVLSGDIAEAKAEYKRAYEMTVDSVSGQGNASQYQDQLTLLNDPVVAADADLQSMAGCYGDDERAYRLTVDNGRLVGRRDDWLEFELFPAGDQQYFMRVPPGYRFSVANDGGSNVLVVNAPGTESRFPAMSGACR